MDDLVDRLHELEQDPAPDLWPDVPVRAPDSPATFSHTLHLEVDDVDASVAVIVPDAHQYLAIVGRVFDGVLDEVDQDLAELVPVGLRVERLAFFEEHVVAYYAEAARVWVELEVGHRQDTAIGRTAEQRAANPRRDERERQGPELVDLPALCDVAKMEKRLRFVIALVLWDKLEIIV